MSKKDLTEGHAAVLADEQGEKESASELSVWEPSRIAGVSCFERCGVDEDRLLSTKEDVVRRRVLETKAGLMEFRCQSQCELSGGMKHLGTPLVGEAWESHPGVLDEEPTGRLGILLIERYGRTFSLDPFEDAALNKCALGHESADRFRQKRGLETSPRGGHDASEDALGGYHHRAIGIAKRPGRRPIVFGVAGHRGRLQVTGSSGGVVFSTFSFEKMRRARITVLDKKFRARKTTPKNADITIWTSSEPEPGSMYAKALVG